MRERVELEVVLNEYYKTRNDNLITEEVYEALKAFCRSVARKYTTNNPKYMNVDELMSLCNNYIWEKIWKFEPHKTKSIISFLYCIINNAILMDIRKDNAKKRRNFVYLEDIVSVDENNKPMTLYDIISDTDSCVSFEEDILVKYAFETMNRTLLRIKEKSYKDSLYYKIHEIMTLSMFHDIPHKEIAKRYGVSHVYINKMVRTTKKELVEDLRKDGFNL